MQAQEWIQLIKMEVKKIDWQESKRVNEALIIQNGIQIEMAKRVIILCDEKIAEFPEDEKKEDIKLS